jgi:hypothetical protein
MARPLRSRALLVSLPLLVCGCEHGLEPGDYALAQASSDRQLDTCNLIPRDGLLPGLSLIVVGQQVTVDFELFGRERPTRMLGRFRKTVVNEDEGFSADGSVIDAVISLSGIPCKVPFGQVHLDATAVKQRSDQFTGLLTLHHELERNQDPRCPLTCDMRVGYRATRSQ